MKIFSDHKKVLNIILLMGALSLVCAYGLFGKRIQEFYESTFDYRLVFVFATVTAYIYFYKNQIISEMVQQKMEERLAKIILNFGLVIGFLGTIQSIYDLFT